MTTEPKDSGKDIKLGLNRRKKYLIFNSKEKSGSYCDTKPQLKIKQKQGSGRELFLRLYNLIQEYSAQTKKSPIYHSYKFTKDFVLWVENLQSISDDARQNLLKKWDYLTEQIPYIRLEDIRRIVEDKRGGELISTNYIGSKGKLKVRCANSHVFSVTRSNLKLGHWCRKCARIESNLKQIRRKFEEIRVIVEDQRGGKLHSNKYINTFAKMKVECVKNHIFQITPHKIKQGQWCRKCAGLERGTIEDIRKIVEGKWAGKLHSTVYINAHTKLKVQCINGHLFKITPHQLKQGKWCGVCAGNRRGTLEEIRKIVEDQRGGKLLSTNYINNRTKVKVQCMNEHMFEIIPSDLKQGHWCAECNIWWSERICRKVFEEIFDVKFPRKRPKWLLNNRGNLMELDGYNETLALAFEYQGIHHYKFNLYFHKNLRNYYRRLENDKLKEELCEKNGVRLIQVPYKISYNQIPEFIFNFCRKNRIQYVNTSIDIRKLINYVYREKSFNKNKKNKQNQIEDYI